MRLTAVCAVHQLLPDAGTIGITATDKRPVTGPVKVGPYGVYADVQADRKHHGGLDKALHAYSEADAGYWSAELGRPTPPGWLGENLRVEGLDVNASLVGEQWRIGADLLVAPVIAAGKSEWTTYLPAGADWVHVWSGKSHAGGADVTVAAPFGQPPVFYRAGSADAALFDGIVSA